MCRHAGLAAVSSHLCPMLQAMVSLPAGLRLRGLVSRHTSSPGSCEGREDEQPSVSFAEAVKTAEATGNGVRVQIPAPIKKPQVADMFSPEVVKAIREAITSGGVKVEAGGTYKVRP